MKEEQFEKLTQYAKREERERILGIIEFYISELGDTTTEKAIARMLRSLMGVIEQ